LRPEKHEPRLSSGTLRALLAASGELDKRAAEVIAPNAAAVATQGAVQSESEPLSNKGTQGCANVFKSGSLTNTRVNQDCSFRFQAEEVIAINPNDSRNLVAGQNDGRIGLNNCGYDWSFDGGKTWGDLVPPFWGFFLNDFHTADGCSDPTASFDARGNAYVGGILFDVFSEANAIVVAKSNSDIGGAFFHSPRAALSFQTYRNTPLGVVVSDDDPNIFNDKELIVADTSAGSPKANNVYATWTRITLNTGTGVGFKAPINFSQSTNGGATWSPSVEISGANAAICTFGSGSTNPNACDDDQASFPIVGPDGTINVAFGNFNTPGAGINQALFVSCPAAADCRQAANWTAPVKINDLIDLQPLGPDPATGCGLFNGCLPPNGYFVPQESSISISVDRDNNLYAVWADFRNGGPPCNTGDATTSTPPCNNDVFYAFSTNRGATWSDAINLAPLGRFGPAAQWQPGSAVTPAGDVLWVAYYDRSYGDCEFTGCNDITLAKIAQPRSQLHSPQYSRLTTASMPNLVPANNPFQFGFLGDYMWVAVDREGRPHVVWADTRGRNGAVEEDIYFARASTP